MKFGKAQYYKFGTLDGSYSIVTPRESEDSQITLTDYEKELVINYFGYANLLTGKVSSNPELAPKDFKLYPNGETINLNINFPKPEKTELRLYLSSGGGFKPNGGEVWFMFIDKGEIWIGALPETEWRVESSILRLDEFDSTYQELIDEPNPIKVAALQSRDVFVRDRTLALKAMRESGYVCEYDKKHELFLSRHSGNPYLEAHHLVPIGLQTQFSRPLDTQQNIYCLCPRCHRIVHHAEKPLAREILETLSNKRKILDEYGMTVNELFNLYAVENID